MYIPFKYDIVHHLYGHWLQWDPISARGQPKLVAVGFIQIFIDTDTYANYIVNALFYIFLSCLHGSLRPVKGLRYGHARYVVIWTVILLLISCLSFHLIDNYCF